MRCFKKGPEFVPILALPLTSRVSLGKYLTSLCLCQETPNNSKICLKGGMEIPKALKTRGTQHLRLKYS